MSAPGDAQKLRHLLGVKVFAATEAVTEAVPVRVGAGAGVLVLRIGAAKMFLAEAFAVVVGNAQRAADSLLDRVPARVVIAARDRSAWHRRGIDLRLQRGKRVQGSAGRRQIRVVMAEKVIGVALHWYARAADLALFRFALPAQCKKQGRQLCGASVARSDVVSEIDDPADAQLVQNGSDVVWDSGGAVGAEDIADVHGMQGPDIHLAFDDVEKAARGSDLALQLVERAGARKGLV